MDVRMRLGLVIGGVIGGVIVVAAAFIGIRALMLDGDDDSAAPASTPASPAKIRVELLKVTCTATEDDLDDEFYVVGGSSLPGTQYAPAAGWGNVAPPIDINSDNTWHDFDQGRVFFDGPAAGVETVHISAVAYDEDTDQRDWSDTAQLASAVGSRLATVNGKVGTAGKATATAADIVSIVGAIRAMDADDQLGLFDADVSILGPDTEILTWKIDHDAGLFGSSYHYEVQIQVTRYV
jgi:hypothetical protein